MVRRLVVTVLAPLPGHPGGVRLLADRLWSTAHRLAALAGVLARLRDGARWEGPAGDAFGARLHEVVPVLDAVSVRLGGAVAPLRSLADAMEEAQAVIGRAVADDDDAQRGYAALEARVASLLEGGVGDGDPQVLLLRHLQLEQVEVQQAARARYAAATERFREADRRVAAVLRSCCLDDIADSVAYRLLAGVSSTGHDLATLGAVGTVVPELRPVAAVADAAAVAADAALLVGYGEGDAGALAATAGLAVTGALGGVLRAGATAGARRTAGGAVSTAALTARQRLALGVVAEVRARRDALQSSVRGTPQRGTPSALLGGPLPRGAAAGVSGSATGAGVAGAGAAGAGAAGAGAAGAAARLHSSSVAAARALAARSREMARKQIDRAFLDDWRLATANGAEAQRMYTAGVTLEAGAAAASKSGAGKPEGGGPVR